MIEGMKYHEIYEEIFDTNDDWNKIEVTVKTRDGDYSFFGDSFGRRILHPRGHYNYTELTDVKCVIDETNAVKYKPSDSRWREVPFDEFTIIAHDPNPRRCGTYEAKIKNGKLIEDNNVECFFDEALSDLSWEEICKHGYIDYIYTDTDGKQYDGVVHII